MPESRPTASATNLPPGWTWFCVRLPDGRCHRFAQAADAAAAVLLRRAWEIWSPARAGPDGRFLAPGLVVEPEPVGVRPW